MKHDFPGIWVFFAVVAIGGLYGYGVSSWLMRRRVNTWQWALLYFLACMAFSFGTWLVWPSGAMGGPCVIGCVFGGTLARVKYLEQKK